MAPVNYQTLEDLGRRMVRELRERLGFPEGVPAYLLWASTPEELWEVVQDFARREAPRAGIPSRALLSLRLVLLKEGFNIVALVFHGGQLHLQGTRAQMLPALRG